MNNIMTTVKVLLAVFVAVVSASVCYSTDMPEINISHYEFGKIIINDKEYLNDIVLWPDGTITAGPEDMHFLRVSDFDELFNSGLKKVVICTGDEGRVDWDFSRKLEKAIKAKGIEIVMMDTHEAVNFLNSTKERDFLAYIHLNC